MIRLKPVWIGIGAIAVAALLYVWWISTHDKVWYDRRLPVEGEASYNDFYVVQQALRAQGVRVVSMPQLQGAESWSGHDSLLLGSDAGTLSPTQVDGLLDWVGRGGRLLVATGAQQQGMGEGLLERIGVFPTYRQSCFQLHGEDKRRAPDCYATFGFRSGERASFQLAVGSASGGWIPARRNWGLGQIEVAGSLDPLRMNEDGYLPRDMIDTETRSDWAWQLFAPMLQGGTFHIVYQSELPPLYVYLVRYGWYALLPLLFALLAWLWARSQRFGPAAPLPAPDRRALGEHIQASGEFLYRRGLIPALYAPLRQRFDEQLRRRDPELAALPPAEIAKSLSQSHRLPLETVQQALRPPQPKQRKVFLVTVQSLLQLMRRP